MPFALCLRRSVLFGPIALRHAAFELCRYETVRVVEFFWVVEELAVRCPESAGLQNALQPSAGGVVVDGFGVVSVRVWGHCHVPSIYHPSVRF